jgi:hypothetical protein
LVHSQLAHLQVAQPQGDAWLVTDDGTAAWMGLAGEVISKLQKGLVKPEFFAFGGFST